MDRYILGISAYFHDSAAALLKNGEVIGAGHEERYTRIKGDPNIPLRTVSDLLEMEGIKYSDLSEVVYYESPQLKFERLLSTTLLGDSKSYKLFLKAMETWLPDKLWVERNIKKTFGKKVKITFSDHHLSHAASAYYPSPYESAAILTLDGVGEWSTTTISQGKGNEITMLKEITFPNSLGMLYSAFTLLCGFKINSGEYKLMGLAPFGEPIYKDLIKEKIIKLHKDGSYELNPIYFAYFQREATYTDALPELFNIKPRLHSEPIEQIHADIARSIQEVTNEVVLNAAMAAWAFTREDNLVLAGGVALNVVSNKYLEENGPFKNIWIQPAAGDAGGALGAALYRHYTGKERRVISKFIPFLGSKALNNLDDFILHLDSLDIKYTQEFEDSKLIELIVHALSENKIIGLCRGRAEFGPRALGHRSILASALDLSMQEKLNLKTKFREGFRPFAPILTKECADLLFKNKGKESPYMLKTYEIKDEYKITSKSVATNVFEKVKEARSLFPAITHVDFTARLQTVSQEDESFTYSLLKEYGKISGHEILVNTSFNVRGEPIINTGLDALNCFLDTEIDILVVDNIIIYKDNISPSLLTSHSREFLND